MSMPRSDLTGQKYGLLTVTHAARVPGYWICQCACGNESKPILGYSLKSGNTKSCGCLRSGDKKTRRTIDEQGMVHDPDRESAKQTILSNTPRRLLLASSLLKNNPLLMEELVTALDREGIKFYIARGKPIYYLADGRWFGPFKTPIQGIGHVMCHAFGTKQVVEREIVLSQSPYSRYRGIRDIPKDALCH